MVGGEGPTPTRTAVVRSSEFSRRLPLRSFGDGLNRLFGIVLSLVNAKDGFLLIDEFENGLHHTIELGVWEAIFRLSKLLNVQVFATSHSSDAVETFQKAAALNPEDGLLIRLSKKGDVVIPTLFRDKELAVATREHIEVR
jgi:ABC-type multidrug transport system ATPase subunit